MIRLGLTAHETPGGRLIADYSAVARGTEFATGDHGFLSLTTTLLVPAAEAVAILEDPAVAHLVLSDGADLAFAGRLEDRRLVAGGVGIGALGYWRALYDLPYTALWSDSSTARWALLTEDQTAAGGSGTIATRGILRWILRWPEKPLLDSRPALPARWQSDNNNRLYLAPTSGEAFGVASAAGIWAYAIPDASARQIVRFTFDYVLDGAAPWRAVVSTRDSEYGGVSDQWTLDADGSEQSGSVELAFSGAAAVSMELFYNDTEATYSGDTGDTYFRITNPRVMTIDAAAVGADDIAAALVAYIAATNAGQIAADTSLVAAPGVDLDLELYEDKAPGDILIDLAARGDDQTPPQLYEVGIYEDQRLFFRPRGSGGRTWHIDIMDPELEASIDTLINSSYAIYDGGKARTATDADAASVAERGITRRAAVAATTTSEGTAEKLRDATIEAGRRGQGRASLSARGVFDESGAPWPGWAVRAGDPCVIRNLPPDSAAFDEIRRFTLAGTRFDVDNNRLILVPRELNTLEFLVTL